MRSSAIGVFDSGLGGLTVVRAIRAALPNERLLYLGDTARVPYGSRSGRTILRYARTCGRHLAADGVKVLVVACNTVSAVALDMLRVELDVPVLGVILPGARAGVQATKTGRLGVIATRGTVASGAYVRAVAALDPRVDVLSRAAPLFVPLAEEGWVDGDVPRQVARKYLAPFASAGVDALVLGCTHYPLLRDVIEEIGAELCDTLAIADSAEATAGELATLLAERELTHQGAGSLAIRVTDQPAAFQQVASRFLGEDVASLSVEQVDL